GSSKGSKGLDRIYPERYFSVPTSEVYLRSLAINHQPFPLPASVNNLQKLSLRYNQNTINIETGIIDFYTRGKSTLRYKLVQEGRDEPWQYGTAYGTIRYDGLVPGKYKLVTQSSNVDGEFNSPDKILLIVISTPFWQTAWFRILTPVTLLLLFYGIYRLRTAALRKQKRVLE
ncbi:MAG: histidine kinase, partial [Chitinophagaceae bacterium]|nr:histidine kinase [Chitinophagaceae bacterium]